MLMSIFSSVSLITNCCLITTTSESREIWSLLTVELAFCSMISTALDGALVTSAWRIRTERSITFWVITPELSSVES